MNRTPFRQFKFFHPLKVAYGTLYPPMRHVGGDIYNEADAFTEDVFSQLRIPRLKAFDHQRTGHGKDVSNVGTDIMFVVKLWNCQDIFGLLVDSHHIACGISDKDPITAGIKDFLGS